MEEDAGTKTLAEIKAENKSIRWDYLANRKTMLFISFIVTVMFVLILYLISSFSVDYIKLVLYIFVIGTYIFLLKVFFEDWLLISKFLKMEKSYYQWKQDLKKPNYDDNNLYYFQENLDLFRLKLLPRVTGVYNSTLFGRDIFDIRVIKVKKEIDIYFSFIIEVLFSKGFGKLLEDNSRAIDYDLAPFFNNFKTTFVAFPGAINPIALHTFFETMNSEIKNNYEEKFNVIKSEVDNYYLKHEKRIEKRNEQMLSIFQTIFGTLIAIVIGIVVVIISQIV